MPNKVVTIGYLKTFVSGILSVSTAYSDDKYCPTYAELTSGNLVTNYKSDTNPTKTTNGIRINGCSVGTSYSSNQLVVEPDLELLYQELQNISVSSSAQDNTVSCCATSTTLSTTAYFKLVTKTTRGTSTASTSTSASVTATYSEDESFTSISGNKISFTKNAVNTSNCTGAPARSSIVTASYTYSGETGKDTATIEIKQNGNNIDNYWTNTSTSTYDVSVSPTSMSFDSSGGTKSYTVTRHYTQYQEKYDECGIAVCFNNYNTSTTVTPSSASASGDFTCTKSNVSIGVNSGSARSGTLTVSYGEYDATCSLSQGASQAGTTNGEPYNYDYYVNVTVASSYVGCEGGTATFNAYYITTWDYDWETKNDAGEVINSGTSSDSSSTKVTNSATWETTLGTVSNGVLTLGAYSEDDRRTATVKATYNGYSGTEIAYQESCAPDIPPTPTGSTCMTVTYTLETGAATTVYFKTTDGTQQGSHDVDAVGSQQLCCYNLDGTTLVASTNDSDVTLDGDTTFVYEAGSEVYIGLKKSGGDSPTCIEKTNYTSLTLSSYTFEACDTSPNLTVKANGIKTYSDCSTATTSTTLSSSNYTTSYDKTPSENQTSSNQTYRVTITGKGTYASLSDSFNIVQDAGPCSSSQDCTCSVTDIKVIPSAHTFTDTFNYEFAVDITDNDCSGCTDEFDVYNSSGEWVTGGAGTFSLPNQSGTFTIKAKDNTSKTCTLTTTKYTAPASTCVIGETITSNGGNGTKVTVGKGGTKTLTIYTKEDGIFSMVSVEPDTYDSDLVSIQNTASSQTEYHTTWVLTASNSNTGSTNITFKNGCGEYVVPFEVTAATPTTYSCKVNYVNNTSETSKTAIVNLITTGLTAGQSKTLTLIGSNGSVDVTNTKAITWCINSITNSDGSKSFNHTTNNGNSCFSLTINGNEITITISDNTPDPVYVMQKTSADTSTSITFPGGTTYLPYPGYICCYSTKDGVKQSVTTSSDSTWLTVSENNDLPYDGANYNFKFDQTENKSTTSRTGKITITQSGSNKTVTWTITQSGKPECSCSVTSISVSPTSHTFTSTANTSFTVTINDNGCNKCDGGFKVYNSSGTYVTSGTSSFTLSNQTGTFTIKANDNTSKTCTLELTKYTPAVVYQYTFKCCNSNKQLALFASNATPSGPNSNFAILDTVDGREAIVTLPSNMGMMVNGSSNSMGGTAKIGDKVKVYSCQGTSSWTLEETITLTAENRSFEYDCAKCNCSNMTISLSKNSDVLVNNDAFTTVTVKSNDGTCPTTWTASNGTTGNTGGILKVSAIGDYVITPTSCTGKSATFNVKEASIVKSITITNNFSQTIIYAGGEGTSENKWNGTLGGGNSYTFNVTNQDSRHTIYLRDCGYANSQSWGNNGGITISIDGDNIEFETIIQDGSVVVGNKTDSSVTLNPTSNEERFNGMIGISHGRYLFEITFQ